MQAWLQGKPREVALAFAARAALRVLPIIHVAEREGYVGNLLLPLFRAASVSWAIARYSARDNELAAAVHDAAVAAQSVALNPRVGFVSRTDSASRATVWTAAFAAALASGVSGVGNPGALGNALHFATEAVGTADLIALGAGADAYVISSQERFWSAFSSDAALVELGKTGSDITGLPLSPEGHPYRPRFWQEMKTALLATKQDWDVWTDWYEDRLKGRVRDEERELAYLRINNELWDQGPAIVNAEIKRRIAALEAPPPPLEAIPEQVSFGHEVSATVVHAPPPEAIPEQTPAATNFRVNSEGLIDVVPDPPAPELLRNALQRELYSEVRRKAKALSELGPNLLGDLNGPAGPFRESLPERIEDLSIVGSWSRGNTLRSRLKAHDVSMNNEEPDPAHLSPLAAEALRDLVHTWNVFIVGDPKGRELDEIRLGPQEADAARQMIAAAAPIVEAIENSENVATPLAIEAVAEQADAAKNASVGIDGDHAVELSRKTTGNFVAEMLRNAYLWCRGEGAVAWREYRAGIYRAAGTATLAGIIAFVVRYADTLKGYVTTVWHNPTVVEIIDWILRALA